jgi:hypothetical protein
MIEVMTPGRLDVDIVRNAVASDESILDGQRFLKRVLSDDVVAAEFQRFLAEHQLSSHAWVMGKVPVNEN